MKCPVCKKSLKKGKLFIGYIHPGCLEIKKANLIIKEAETPVEMKYVEKLCLDTYGETDFVEMDKWYDVRNW